MTSKNKSKESPQSQLAAFRLQLQQPNSPTMPEWKPVSSIGEGIAQGIHNAINYTTQARNQKAMLNFLQQYEAEQRAAEAKAAEQHVYDTTNFLMASGVDPWTAINAGSAGADVSTQNMLIKTRHDDIENQAQLRDKSSVYASYIKSLKAKGLPDADAVLMANSAMFGERLPIGASELGNDIGGTMKNNRVFMAQVDTLIDLIKQLQALPYKTTLAIMGFRLWTL